MRAPLKCLKCTSLTDTSSFSFLPLCLVTQLNVTPRDHNVIVLNAVCVSGWHLDHWSWTHTDGSRGGVLLFCSQSLRNQFVLVRVWALGGSTVVVGSAHNTRTGLELHVASSTWLVNLRQVEIDVCYPSWFAVLILVVCSCASVCDVGRTLLVLVFCSCASVFDVGRTLRTWT